MMKSSRTIDYQCGKCNTGVVKVVLSGTNQSSGIIVKKCSHCKHQYGLKGVMSLHQEVNPLDNREVAAIKSGRAWNGAHRDGGTIVHAVIPLPPTSGGDWFTKALCGTEPGRRGNGWYKSDKEINCPKCLKKL